MKICKLSIHNRTLNLRVCITNIYSFKSKATKILNLVSNLLNKIAQIKRKFKINNKIEDNKN